MTDVLTTTPPTPVFLDLPLRLELSRRQRTNYSQTEMAALLGVSKRTVLNYENGHTEPSISLVKKWADICNVPQEWLVFGVERDPLTGEIRSRCFASSGLVVGAEGVTPVPEIPTGIAADKDFVYTELALGA